MAARVLHVGAVDERLVVDDWAIEQLFGVRTANGERWNRSAPKNLRRTIVRIRQ